MHLPLGRIELHGLHAGEALLQVGRRVGQRLAGEEEGSPDAQLEEAHHDQQQRQHREQHEGRLPAQPEHHAQEGERLQEIDEEREHVAGEALAERLDIAGHSGQDRADGIAVEVAPGEAQRVPVHGLAQRRQQPMAGALKNAHIQRIGEVAERDHRRGEGHERQERRPPGLDVARRHRGQQIVVHGDLEEVGHQRRAGGRGRQQGEHGGEAPPVGDEMGTHRFQNRRGMAVEDGAPQLAEQPHRGGGHAFHRGPAFSAPWRRHDSR